MNIKKINPVTLARIFIMLQLACICISTAAASFSEALIYLTFLGSAQLRRRVLEAARQPMVIMTLVLWAMVGIGTIHSAAPFADALDTWGSWRKCLLLPLAAAVFDEPEGKKQYILFFIGLMTIGTLLSFVSFFYDFHLYSGLDIGIAVCNSSTQGMFFSVAVFSCLTLILSSKNQYNLLFCIAAALIGANIIFVSYGRAGYLSLILLMAALAFWQTRGRIRLILMAALPIIIIVFLTISPTSRHRMIEGYREMANYQTDKTITPMGTRMVFWKNTLAILKKKEHPFIGYGTDGFKVPYREQVKGVEGWQGVFATDPHNQYLKILVEHGIIGLIVFFLFIASFFRQTPPPPFHYLGIGVVLAWLATSFFHGHFGTFYEGRFLYLWCGVMLTHPNQDKQASGTDNPGSAISPDQ